MDVSAHSVQTEAGDNGAMATGHELSTTAGVAVPLEGGNAIGFRPGGVLFAVADSRGTNHAAAE